MAVCGVRVRSFRSFGARCRPGSGVREREGGAGKVCPNLKLHKRTEEEEKEGLARSHLKIITIASGFTSSSPRPMLEGKNYAAGGRAGGQQNRYLQEMLDLMGHLFPIQNVSS